MSQFKTWANGALLTAADLNAYLMRQAVIVVTNDTDRNNLPSPSQGMTVFNMASARLETYFAVYHATNNPQGRETAGWYSHAWRKHAEFTTSQASAGNAALSQLGTLTFVDADSNDDNFAAYAGTAGRLRLKETGIYSVSAFANCSGPTTGRTFSLVQRVSDSLILDFRDINVSENPYFAYTIPNLQVTAINTDLDFQLFQTTGGAKAVTGRIRVTKVADL